MKGKILLNKFKITGLLVYFMVIFTERVMAAVFSIGSGGVYAVKAGNPFNYITYSVTILSLIAGVILTAKPFNGLVKGLFSKEGYDFAGNYKAIVIAAMAFLYGGMMHTGFTLAPMQFVAYGFLIASMVVRTIEKCIEDKSKRAASIVSVIYLTLFSMTVPVCYIALALGGLTVFFYIAEFLAAFVLIPVFGIMLYKFFTNGVTSFSPLYPAIMLVLSGAAVALKWSEEINYFVLIFVSLTTLFYLCMIPFIITKKLSDK